MNRHSKSTEMNTKKVMWAYMLNFGNIGTPSYYGGSDVPIGHNKDKYLMDIEENGINWNKTSGPESDRVAEFDGTFAEPNYTEMLLGKLILKNGKYQDWFVRRCDLGEVIKNMPFLMQEVNDNPIYRD